MLDTQNHEIFSEINPEEATQINGGFTTQQWLGAALGNLGSAWWSRNFWGNVNQGNINGAIAVTDRYVRGLTNSLARFGIAVPRYPF